MASLSVCSSPSSFIPSRNVKICLASASSIDVEGKTDVHDHVLARLHVGDVIQADAFENAAEIDFAHQDVVLVVSLDDLTGDREAHALVPLGD